MNWFSGNIAEAVKLSKTRNSVFVVFVEGPNESSKELLALMNSAEISSLLESKQCVSIRIQSETESYTQFAEIYKLVPLPSVFLIGTNGIPLTIVTETTKVVAELETKIRSALGDAVPEPQSATSGADEAAAAATNDDDAAASATINPEDSAEEAQKKLEFYRAQIELKRRQKEEEQRKLDKERELERRRVGQELRSFKERQNELDLKQLKEERQRDRLQEQATRKRILEQIAQDRAINNERFSKSAANASPPETPTTTDKPLPKKYDGTEARIQFKKPDGSVESHEFTATDQFHVVRAFVTNTLFAGNANFTLASSFPRRLFNDEDSSKTLVELDLAPTSVILIMSTDKALKADPPSGSGVAAAVGGAITRYDIWGMFQSALWTIITPILTVFGYLGYLLGARAPSGNSNESTGAEKRANEDRISDNDAAKRRNLNILQPPEPQPSTSTGSSGGAYKRPAATSNIHRLRDTQDSDDDTNTWNGNSTQQQ